MTEIAHHTPATPHPAPVVWILSAGELHEGGHIIGVYADRGLALGQLADEAQDINARFSIDEAQQDENGAIHIVGGCDWLALKPYPVTTRAQLPQGTA